MFILRDSVLRYLANHEKLTIQSLALPSSGPTPETQWHQIPLQCIYLQSTIQQLLTTYRSLLKQLPIIQCNAPKPLVLQRNQLLTQ